MPDWKVLIVDDEKDFVSTLAERLRLRGIRADEAPSGEEALAMIAADAPQVVGTRYHDARHERIRCTQTYQSRLPAYPGHTSDRSGDEEGGHGSGSRGLLDKAAANRRTNRENQ